MYDVHCVNMLYCYYDLKKYFLNQAFTEALAFNTFCSKLLHSLPFNILKYNVQILFIVISFVKLDNIGVIKRLEQLYLVPQGRKILRLELILGILFDNILLVVH